LFGIKTPEKTETCNANGRQWSCGQDAAFALAYETGGHWVTCRERGRLANGEMIAQCFAGPYDLSARMVSKGWATVDRERTSDYVDDEEAARAARIGIWRID
jgi:endonuclease YncB( thermonuclease family)